MTNAVPTQKFPGRRKFGRLAAAVLWVLPQMAGNLLPAAEPPAPQFDFFEKRIRPVLVERCHKCHSAQAEKLKGALVLDSREGLLKGGDTGPAIVPGTPEKSLLLRALSYADADLQMPPQKAGGKLSAAQIADFKTWIQQGAPWPAQIAAKSESKLAPFDLEKRRREHWAWQPVKPQTPPKVKNSKWPANPIDNFILARLEANGLKPAPAADKRTLIRRATFDLIGLPPTSAEIEAFLNDDSKDAFAKVVDRLLASPHFGERWARHWLDRVRYAETMGHEFDYQILNAWRYRDYVIRALNDDLPYDRFVKEHVAGDLLSQPRIGRDGVNESATATAFYWFIQQVHAPVDIRQAQAEAIDNQIDVLSKAFLALTVSCARCHDHKFDAISTKDFYSLYGVLSSSRYSAKILNSEAMASAAKPLVELKARLREAVAKSWEREAEHFAARLPSLAATDKMKNLSQPLYAWTKLAKAADFSSAKEKLHGELKKMTDDAGIAETGSTDFSDFTKWFRDGPAFAPAGKADFIVGTNATQPVAALIAPVEMHSARVSTRLQGELRSPTFIIERRYLHALAAGSDARLRVVIDNFTLIRSPIYGGLHQKLDHSEPQWVKFDLEMWQGHRAYLELADNETTDPAEDKPSAKKKLQRGDNGFASLSRVVFSDNSAPPVTLPWPAEQVLTKADSIAALAANYQRELLAAIRAWRDGSMNKEQFALLDWARSNGVFSAKLDENITSLARQFLEAEDAIPEPIFIAAMTEGTPLDENVFIRGSHRKLGETVTRRFLEGLEGAQPKPFTDGSGRLELAEKLASPNNPLTARVMVNSVWHHLFGRGIVPTVDNFGALGEKPSHPELLDWLAASFAASPSSQPSTLNSQPRFDWSVKKLIREMMLSRAYQMASASADSFAEERDPNNLLWHRMNLRRLEGEAIRDAMFAVSGRLDATLFGEPVPVHLTPFMDGRGRPAQSGPLDGAGRRSIYVEVRRNFITPMMLAFDTPVPATTVGRRAVSNVPAQALILMNDPFVAQQAQVWAKKLLAGGDKTDSERVSGIYLSAFGRPPNKAELAEALGFLDEQAKSYETGAKGRTRAWADLCHVVFNSKEFIFLN